MYTVKFIPYSHGVDRSTHVLSTDEYQWNVKYPENIEALREILDENRGFIVIWEIPLSEKINDEMAFPEGGIQLVLLTTYRNTNLEGQNSMRVSTYIAYDCSMFVMNNHGKTIDRVG